MPKLNKKDANRIDSEYEHIAIVRPRGDFKGGSFSYDYDEIAPRGLYKVYGVLINDNDTKTVQRVEFSPTQFTEDQAKKWMDDNSIAYSKFKPCSKDLNIDKGDKTPPNQDTGVAAVSTAKKTDRIDYLPDTLDDSWMVDKFQKTSEGFLKGRAIVTNVGVFPYLQEDGTVRRELRPPEEVFHPDSIKSLAMMPMTNDHPSTPVDAENSKELSVGFIGDMIYADAYHLSAPITISDAVTVENVQAGKRALSAGYSVDLEEKSGVWMGVAYDAIQRNIRYNHVAVVDRGRAGDAAKIKLDSGDGIAITVQNIKEDVMSNLKKVKIDSVEYDAEAKVIETLHNTQQKLDAIQSDLETLKTENSGLQAKADSATDEVKDLKTKLDEAQKIKPELITKAVNDRLELLSAAEKADVEVKEDMDDNAVKKAVILKAFPNAAGKLDGADDAYITGRFDAAKEKLDEVDNASNKNRLAAAGMNQDGSGESDDLEEINADKAYQKRVDEMKSAWKK